MKPDHRAELFALAAVVRRVAEDFAAHGRTVSEEPLAGLAAVR